jgi:hypothetical protein
MQYQHRPCNCGKDVIASSVTEWLYKADKWGYSYKTASANRSTVHLHFYTSIVIIDAKKKKSVFTLVQ